MASKVAGRLRPSPGSATLNNRPTCCSGSIGQLGRRSTLCRVALEEGFPQQQQAVQSGVDEQPVAGPGPSSIRHKELEKLNNRRRAIQQRAVEAWVPTRQDSSVLTLKIREAQSCSELLELLQHNSQQGFNAIHLSASMHRTVKLYKQERLRPYDARIISSQILPLLVGLLRSMLATLQPRAIATITYSLASLDVRDKELLAELAGRAEGKLSEFTSQGLSNMLWAFARSELQPPARWMEAYLGVCHAKLGTFSAQELATLMWSLSKLKYKVSEDKLADFLSAAHTHMPKAQPQSLAMFAYSLGAMEQRPGEGWLDALVTAMLRSPGLARFTPQGLSQTLWALSRLDYQPSPVLAQAVCRHLSSLLSTPKGRASYKGIDLATTMYSMARMRMHVPGVLYSRLLECLRQRMLSLDPTHVANSCWALACFQAQNPIRYPNHEFWLAVFSAVHVRLERFNPHDLAMLAWALARLDVPLPEPFLMSFQRRVEQVGALFSPTEVAHTLWALAHWGAPPSTSLLAEFFLATDRRLSAFKAQELASMAWALARTSHAPDRQWAEEFLRAAFHRLPEFSPQGLANMVWALGRLQIRPPPAWLYAYVKSAKARLHEFGVLDLKQAMEGLQAINGPPQGQQLQKVDDFVAEVAEALVSLQLQVQAQQQAQAGQPKQEVLTPRQQRALRKQAAAEAAAVAAATAAEAVEAAAALNGTGLGHTAAGEELSAGSGSSMSSMSSQDDGEVAGGSSSSSKSGSRARGRPRKRSSSDGGSSSILDEASRLAPGSSTNGTSFLTATLGEAVEDSDGMAAAGSLGGSSLNGSAGAPGGSFVAEAGQDLSFAHMDFGQGLAPPEPAPAVTPAKRGRPRGSGRKAGAASASGSSSSGEEGSSQEGSAAGIASTAAPAVKRGRGRPSKEQKMKEAAAVRAAESGLVDREQAALLAHTPNKGQSGRGKRGAAAASAEQGQGQGQAGDVLEALEQAAAVQAEGSSNGSSHVSNGAHEHGSAGSNGSSNGNTVGSNGVDGPGLGAQHREPELAAPAAAGAH